MMEPQYRLVPRKVLRNKWQRILMPGSVVIKYAIERADGPGMQFKQIMPPLYTGGRLYSKKRALRHIRRTLGYANTSAVTILK